MCAEIWKIFLKPTLNWRTSGLRVFFFLYCFYFIYVCRRICHIYLFLSLYVCMCVLCMCLLILLVLVLVQGREWF